MAMFSDVAHRRVRGLRWPSRKQSEDGFTIVELMVALLIITTVLVVLAATTYTAFGSIGVSRQRDTATELANQAMEQIKALSFNDLVMGYSDVSTGDPLVTCSGTPSVCEFQGRTIPTTTGTNPPAPLYPHIPTPVSPAVGTSNPGPTAYTVASYITFDSNGNTQDRIATVRVTWSNPVKGGVQPLVQVESTIFATGPLASGSGHAWSAQATDSPGTISVSGTLVGIPLANVSFGPGSTNASIGVDGTASATATVAQSEVQLLGLPLENTPQSSATAASGPSAGSNTPGPNTNTQSDNGLVSSSLEGGILNLVDSGHLGITGGLGNTATTSAVAASSASGAVNLSGQTMPNSSLPYAQAEASQTGPLSVGLDLSLLSVLGITLGSTNLSLLSLTPLGNANPDVATVCQQASSGAGCLPATPSLAATLAGVAQPSYPGSAITAQAQKDFLDISVLGGSVLDIQGFVAAASAAAGPGISNSGRSGEYAGSITLLGQPLTLVNHLLPVITNAITSVSSVLGAIGVTLNLSEGSATQSGNSASATSPINLTIGLSLAGILSLNISVNLGSVSASASYT